MAIHRVGPLPDAAPRQTSLGRVLVTIDDLAALMDIMRQHASDPASLKVHFSGGFFTEPEDLRQLSDDETTTLKVHSDNAEVNLESTRVVAIGDDAIRAKMLNTWARARQTTYGTTRDVVWAVASLCFIALIATSLLIYALVNSRIDPGGKIGLTVTMIAVLGFLAYLMRGSVKVARSKPGTIVAPMSLNEFRQFQRNNQYPRASWIVAIVAVIVAVLTIVATLVVPFITPR